MSDLYMVRHDAPYVANCMPNHPGKKMVRLPRGVKRNTTGFNKHLYGTAGHYVDTMIIQNDLGKIYTRDQIEKNFETYSRSAPNFGSRGGTRADINAKRWFCALLKEGLIVKV